MVMRPRILGVPLLSVVLGAALAPAGVAHADWTVIRDPFDPAVIARYKAMLARDPHDPVLTQLVALYRRHRSVALLAKDYESAVTPGWTTYVVLGRIHHVVGDPAKALEAWSHAVALSPDARTWILIAEARRAAGQVREARTAYDQALQHANADISARVLSVLEELAELAGEPLAVAGYLQQHLVLDPKNVRLWIAHGDAMAAAGRGVEAFASYGEAEQRLGSDRARRADVVARRADMLSRQGDRDAATLELRRAIELAPVSAETMTRIAGTARRDHMLPTLVGLLEVAWPERARSFFQWTTLGELYEETGAHDRAIATFTTALDKTPSEIPAQHRLVQLLDAAGRQEEATQRYEHLVRTLPREPVLALALARRYWPTRPDDAVATLTRLAARVPANMGIQSAIADQLVKWNRRDFAIRRYEQLARRDPSFLVTLGELYAAIDDRRHVVWIAARIDARHDPALSAEISRVMLEHAMWNEAIERYSKAIDRDPKNPAHWTGRGAAEEGLRDWEAAAVDAQEALARTTTTDRRARHIARHAVVRAVLASSERDRYVAAWRRLFAEEPPDPDIGYMLAEFIAVRPCSVAENIECLRELRVVLKKLIALVPEDPEPRKLLVSEYTATGEYDRAIDEVHALAPLVPDQVKALEQRVVDTRAEVTKLAAESPSNRRMAPLGWTDLSGEEDRSGQRGSRTRTRDALDTPIRFGLRVGAGAGLGNTVRRTVVMGASTLFGITPKLAVVVRADWTQRDAGRSSVDAIGGGTGLAARIATTPNALVTLGAVGRGEFAFGEQMSSRFRFAGDLTLDLTSRRTPFGVGIRLERPVTGGSTATLELAIELR